MQNQTMNAEMRQLVDRLKACFWAELRQKIGLKVRPGRFNSDVGPLTHPLTLSSTMRFFWVWRSFSPALEFMTPSLGAKLERMTAAAENLSSRMDAYDSGDRCGDSDAALQFLQKAQDVKAMISEMPA